MAMLAPALLLAATAIAPAPAATVPITARAQVTATVRFIQAAELRSGRTDSPHQRRVRRDEAGSQQILIEFE
jgi:hypothetical protein